MAFGVFADSLDVDFKAEMDFAVKSLAALQLSVLACIWATIRAWALLIDEVDAAAETIGYCAILFILLT